MRSLLSGGYVDPNFPNPGRDDDTSIIIYGYTPSLALAVVGAVTFGICAIAAIGLLIRNRFSWVVLLTLIATSFEIVGYVNRSLSSQVDPYRLSFFVVQYFFIVTAPVFISAAIYLAFGQLLKLTAGEKSPVSTRAVFGIFLGFDIVTTIIQIAGAASVGTAESNDKDPTPANNALLSGLAIQVASFAVFLIIYVTCIAKFKGLPKANQAALGRNKHAFVLLFVVAALVEVRTIFRLVETAQGVYGYLSTHEPYFGALEFAPIILAVSGTLWLSSMIHEATAAPILPENNAQTSL